MIPTDEDYIESLIDPTDGIVPVEIDIDQIEKDSAEYVVSMVTNLSKFYYDDAFMSTHPVFKKRVDADIDSLKLLIKMRSVDNETQNAILRAISGNSGNASLYRALTDIQRTLLNIQTKIEDTIKSLELFMKGYQLEIDFSTENSSEYIEDSDDGTAEIMTRGSKEFIQQMKGTV